MKTACVAFGSGCPRSKVNVTKLFEYFRLNGYELVDEPREADILVTGACAVDIAHERESFRLLDRINNRRKPGGLFVLMSCFPGIVKEKAKARYPDMRHVSELDEVIKAKVKLGEVPDPNLLQEPMERASKVFSAWDRLQSADKTPVEKLKRIGEIAAERLGIVDGQPFYRDRAKRIYSVKLGRGCLEECTYCAIRFDSGKLVSKPLPRVLDEFDAGLQEGYKNYELLLDDVGAYGQDIGTDFTVLLTEIFARPPAFNLKLTDIGPHWALRYEREFKEALGKSRGRVVQLMLPVQSGSDEVLKRMKRRYSAKEVIDFYLSLKKEFPTLYVTTHVIVGFPGETEGDYRDTIRLLKTVQFNHVGVYEYGDRPNTEASSMADKIPREVIRQRRREIVRAFA